MLVMRDRMFLLGLQHQTDRSLGTSGEKLVLVFFFSLFAAPPSQDLDPPDCGAGEMAAEKDKARIQNIQGLVQASAIIENVFKTSHRGSRISGSVLFHLTH